MLEDRTRRFVLNTLSETSILDLIILRPKRDYDHPRPFHACGPDNFSITNDATVNRVTHAVANIIGGGTSFDNSFPYNNLLTW